MSPEARTDSELLHLFRDRQDRAALSSLFERHRALAYRVALSVVRSPADAEDAAQDAFLRLVGCAGRVHSEGSLAGLIARLALRSAQDMARSAGRRRARELAAQPPEDVTDRVFEEFAEREARRTLRAAVDSLDDRYRLPILLHYFDGLSTRETAEALGITQTAVTTRLSRAVGKLRDQMRRGGLMLSGPALLALLGGSTADAVPASLVAGLETLAATAPATAPAAGGLGALVGGVLAFKAAAMAAVVVISLGGIGALRRLPPPARAAAGAKTHVASPSAADRHSGKSPAAVPLSAPRQPAMPAAAPAVPQPAARLRTAYASPPTSLASPAAAGWAAAASAASGAPAAGAVAAGVRGAGPASSVSPVPAAGAVSPAVVRPAVGSAARAAARQAAGMAAPAAAAPAAGPATAASGRLAAGAVAVAGVAGPASPASGRPAVGPTAAADPATPASGRLAVGAATPAGGPAGPAPGAPAVPAPKAPMPAGAAAGAPAAPTAAGSAAPAPGADRVAGASPAPTAGAVAGPAGTPTAGTVAPPAGAQAGGPAPPPLDPEVRRVIEQAGAVDRMRFLAIASIRGYVVYDYRRSEAEMSRGRKLSQEIARKYGRIPMRSADSPRTLCAVEFVAAEDRLKLDGVMLNDGATNPWSMEPWRPDDPSPYGMVVLPPGQAVAPAEAASPSSSAGRAGRHPMPRTVIIRDGERELRYVEGRGDLIDQPQRPQGPPGVSAAGIGQHPLAEYLFGSGVRMPTGVPAFAGAPAPVQRSYEKLGESQVQGTRCIQIRASSPGWEETYWVAPGYGFARVRKEQMRWVSTDQTPPMLQGDLWTGDRFRQVAPGVWLPTRVRVQRTRVRDDGAVEWLELSTMEYYGLVVNQPLGPNDFVFAGPPLGTLVTELVEVAGGGMRSSQRSDAGREEVWWRATEWQRQAPAVDLESEFATRVREYYKATQSAVEGAKKR